MSFPAQTSTVEAQPLIAVRNVRASSRWYAELLGADSLPDHPHRDFYDRIWRSGRLLLQLHAWDADDHPNLVNADAALPDMESCCGSKSTISTRLSRGLAGWGRRSSRNRASTLRPSTGRFGSATPMATLSCSPVRTAKGARDRGWPRYSASSGALSSSASWPSISVMTSAKTAHKAIVTRPQRKSPVRSLIQPMMKGPK